MNQASLTNSERWQIIDDGAATRSGAANMAVDHALLESVQNNSAPILRFYRWSRPTLSLGRNQAALGIYQPTPGRDLVRRPTGGLAVLHAREITYAVALPARRLGGPRATYLAINQALLAGLRELGVEAEVASASARARFGTVEPCFAEAAEGELIARGRKLVGSAQRYERHALLQHGSILLANDQPKGAISLEELLGTVPAVADIVATLSASFARVCGICLAPGDLTGQQRKRAAELEAWYASEAWTWRK